VRIPQEKSVVGFDDNYLAQLTEPGLTTVHQDADQKGIWAMNMILSQLRGEEMEQKEVILPVNLTERGSVCRIRFTANWKCTPFNLRCMSITLPFMPVRRTTGS